MPIDDALFRQAADLVDRADDVAIVSHQHPDGDAIGSTVAVRDVLRRRGKRVEAFLLDPVPKRYASLVADDPVEVWDQAAHADLIDRAGCVVVLDTASWSQLEAVEAPLRRVEDRLIVIDHHQTSDEMGGVHLIDSTAAAAGLIVHEWFRSADWPLSRTSREALFAALATDTGWFRFSNADARALSVAAELVEAGVEAYSIYETIYWSESTAKLALTARALSTLTLHLDGRVAVMQLDNGSFQACGADRSDTEDLINEPMRIGSVFVSVLLVEQPDGQVRVGLRSKGQVDVAAVAGSRGGGGHLRAAGARLGGPMADAASEILGLLGGAMGGTEAGG